MASDSAVRKRWTARLVIRRALERAARQRYIWNPTAANKATLAKRREQIAYAERVIARHQAPAGEPAHDTRTSPNQSSRRGVAPRVIVLHSTEGGYAGSISWLCNPRAQASAHVVVSAKGDSTRLVADDAKAWHVAADNPYTLGIEQEGYAAQKTWPEAQLRATAAWVAYWAAKHDIPITHSTEHGVCQHADLGAAGGGHHDCGPAYPFNHVLELARSL